MALSLIFLLCLMGLIFLWVPTDAVLGVSQRIFYIRAAFDMGLGVEDLYDLTGIDPWFLQNLAEIVEVERELVALVS